MHKGGCVDDVSFGTAGDVGAGAVADGDMVFVFDLFASGEFGRDGGACSFCTACRGGDVEALVITWNSRQKVILAVGSL